MVAMIGVGDPAPDLDLIDDRDESWSVHAHRGRPVVLVFHRHFY